MGRRHIHQEGSPSLLSLRRLAWRLLMLFWSLCVECHLYLTRPKRLSCHTAVVSYKADKPNHSRGINPAMATDSRRTRRGSRFPRQMETLNLPRTNQTRGLLKPGSRKKTEKNVVPNPPLPSTRATLLTLHSRCVLLALRHMHAVYTCCMSQQCCMLCPQGLSSLLRFLRS